MTDQDYEEWFRKARKKQKVFVNTYLKTLDPDIAYKTAGYNYSNPSFGKWKVFNDLFPVIQYKISKYDLQVNKPFIVQNWLKLLFSSDNKTKATALKELSKLFGYVDQNNIAITNNIPSTPIQITFSKDNNQTQKGN